MIYSTKNTRPASLKGSSIRFRTVSSSVGSFSKEFEDLLNVDVLKKSKFIPTMPLTIIYFIPVKVNCFVILCYCYESTLITEKDQWKCELFVKLYKIPCFIKTRQYKMLDNFIQSLCYTILKCTFNHSLRVS